MIYAVGMRSRSRNPPMGPGGLGPGGLQAMLVADLPDPGIARVADETGGGYIEIRFGQDLGAAFAGIADELHTQYLLAFTPPIVLINTGKTALMNTMKTFDHIPMPNQISTSGTRATRGVE